MQPTVIENQFGYIPLGRQKALSYNGKYDLPAHQRRMDRYEFSARSGDNENPKRRVDEGLHGPFKRVYGPRELGAGKERIHNERQGIYHEGYVYSFPTTHGFHGRMAGTEVSSGWYRIKVQAESLQPSLKDAMFGDASGHSRRPKHPTYRSECLCPRELQEFVFDAWIRKDHIIASRPDKTIPWVSSRRFVDT